MVVEIGLKASWNVRCWRAGAGNAPPNEVSTPRSCHDPHHGGAFRPGKAHSTKLTPIGVGDARNNMSGTRCPAAAPPSDGVLYSRQGMLAEGCQKKHGGNARAPRTQQNGGNITLILKMEQSDEAVPLTFIWHDVRCRRSKKREMGGTDRITSDYQ